MDVRQKWIDFLVGFCLGLFFIGVIAMGILSYL